jgi:hypothetical protein
MLLRQALAACMVGRTVIALLALGGLVVCAPVACKGKARSALPTDASPPREPEQRETVCFKTDWSVAAINDEGIWTAKGRAFDADGRRRLPELKPSYYGMIHSFAFDRDLIVAAGTPDKDSSRAYWIDAFAKDGRPLWSVNLDPSDAFTDSHISVRVAFVPQSGTVSVLIFGETLKEVPRRVKGGSSSIPIVIEGQPYEPNNGDLPSPVFRHLANMAELRSYSRDGKLLARRKLTDIQVDEAAFSTTGELALAGTAERGIDLGALTGSSRLQLPAGVGFAARYDQDGRPQWARAFKGPRRLLANIRFDDEGNLWSALFARGARDAEPYSVVGGTAPAPRIILQPSCTGYYVVDKFGAVVQRESAPCSPPSRANRRPLTEDPSVLFDAAFALLGGGGHVWGQSRDPIPGRQVIDLRSADGEGGSHYLWPLTSDGPAVRLPGTVMAAGFFHGRLCMEVHASGEQLRCDLWAEDSRWYSHVVICLPASPLNTISGGPS